MRVVFALWMREVRKYFRSPAQMIGTLGSPVMYLGVLGFGRIGQLVAARAQAFDMLVAEQLDRQGDAMQKRCQVLQGNFERKTAFGLALGCALSAATNSACSACSRAGRLL